MNGHDFKTVIRYYLQVLKISLFTPVSEDLAGICQVVILIIILTPSLLAVLFSPHCIYG